MLSIRAYNALKRAQVNSVSDLTGFSYEDLMELPNLKTKKAEELVESLRRVGIQIPESKYVDSSPPGLDVIPDPWM